jgi:hypothetical protein
VTLAEVCDGGGETLVGSVVGNFDCLGEEGERIHCVSRVRFDRLVF